MRTSAEIVERIESLVGDVLGFQRTVLLGNLPFDDARRYLDEKKIAKTGEAECRQSWEAARKQGSVDGSWTPDDERKAILKEMLDYLGFAWEKATGHRGISASRSIDKFTSWLWLLGEDELLARFLAAPFQNYGAPQLMIVSEFLVFDLGELEKWETEPARRMAAGKRCRDDCQDGCGR